MTKYVEAVAPASTFRVLIVDDHAILREGVRLLLSLQPQWEVCGEAENGKEAVEKVRELNPDVVVLDMNMPVMNGAEAARKIRDISPGTKILILTMEETAQVADLTRDSGVDAIIEKPEAANALTKTMERLMEDHLVSCAG